MKISLTAITGNAETYAQRWADAFVKPGYFDEVVVVRAIGGAAPDKTLEILQAAGCVTGEYHNAPELAHWEHLDDFAAARNAAARLATGDWLCWADMDDILDPDALKHMRQTIQKCDERGYAIVLCPYRLLNNGLGYNGQGLMRERFWKRDKTFWVDPVHEHLEKPPGGEMGGLTRNVWITHAPPRDKKHTGSNDRNLRIIDAKIKTPLDGRWSFYRAQECFGLGRKAEAVQNAIDACNSDVGAPEKVEMYMALANSAEKIEEREKLAMAAWDQDPGRREALFYLSVVNGDAGKKERSLAFARCACALPQPKDPVWTHRGQLYDWAGDFILCMALRQNGLIDEARKIEQATFARGGKRISVLHPTRRWKDALARRREWMEQAANPAGVEWIFAVDEDDPEGWPIRERFPHVVVPKATWDKDKEGGTFCAAMNLLAAASTGQVLFQMADDWFCPPRWDDWIWNSLKDYLDQPRLLTIVDHPGRPAGFDLCCFPAMTRKMYERNGWFYYPEYRHVYTDTDLSVATRKAGERIDVPQPAGFLHDHPLLTGKPMDDVYRLGNSAGAYEHGARIFKARHPEAAA